MIVPDFLKSADIENLVTLNILAFDELECQTHIELLWNEIEDMANFYRLKYSSPSQALEKLQPARKLYRSIGIEPTRIRPSSEALLRRAIKGKALYQVNSIVDVCNLCSLFFLLPIGLYDLAKINGNIAIRFGYSNESYSGIGKGEINVQNRLCLADNVGPFGNPSSDSLRTSITLNTNRVLLVIFAPKNYPTDQSEQNIRYTEQKIQKYHIKSKTVLKKII
jgi:DNA/RNA-binding domain of Phe-tRNA-synthetase-like protein